MSGLFARVSPFAAVTIAGIALLGLGGCEDADGQGEVAAFCDAVDELRTGNPFAQLEVASPEEMRTAFEDLRDGAELIAETAPDEYEVSAARYRDSVDELIDQLRGAGFDPRELDTLAYRSATEEYSSAADSVDNAADAVCGS